MAWPEVVWPEDWPRYKQCNVSCDMLEGPCLCGAWHGSGEFQLIAGKLHRYGKPTCSESWEKDGEGVS